MNQKYIFIGFSAFVVLIVVFLVFRDRFFVSKSAMSSSQSMPQKTLEALIDSQQPAWPLVKEWISQSKIDVEILPAEIQDRERALLAAQITTRSPMGAILYETGGLIVDSGWLRILGAKSARLKRSLPEWNRELFPELWDKPTPPPLIVIADDVIGGLFALNGGALGSDAGQIYYFAPDALGWEPLNMGYSEFLQWIFAGNTQKFYEAAKWTAWKADLKTLSGDQGFSFYPFLFAEAPSLEARQRKVMPFIEICRFNFEFIEKAKAK